MDSRVSLGVGKEMKSRKVSVLLLLTALVPLQLGCRSKTDTVRQSGPQQQTSNDQIQLLFSYGSEKQKWIDDVTATFNQSGTRTAGGKRILVKAVPKGSGECVDDVLSGAEQDDLTSPASNVFIKLGNAKSRAATGQDLIGASQNLLLSPVVIAMWKPMAEAIGWGKKPIGWADILALARDKQGWSTYGFPQWGSFKFGHTHPAYSNSGIISLIAENYAATGKVRGLTLADVQNPKTRAFVSGIENSVVHYGSSTGFFGRKLFDSGPEYLSAAVLYESMVVESYAKVSSMPFPVVAIYPREGTFWSDHPVGIVNRPWVTPERQEAAQIYIRYLLARPQQEKAMTYGFRPGSPDVAVGPPIDAAHGVDPKQPTTTLEVPSSEVISALQQQWDTDEKKGADIVLVLDTSGSMREEEKMVGAKAGAKQLVSLLSDKDDFSLLPFNTTAAWASQDQPAAQGRQVSDTAIDSVFPAGQTALYDAVDQGYAHLLAQPGEHIRALVVLTDGEDNKSAETLEQLLAKIHPDAETHTIRIFTIAYGHDARRDVLQQIADSTQGKAYDGTPTNIVEVFRDISTFF
jgi:Ca-activated chloride channel homolog